MKVDLTLEELERLENWFGLLENDRGPNWPKEDRALLEKISSAADSLRRADA